MASLGSIFVDLLARTGKFDSAIDASRNKTKRAFKDMSDESSRSANAISSAWSGASEIIATSINALAAGALFTKFIQNTINAQNEQAQLAAVLRSTGNAAGYSVEQLNRMGEAMSNNSIFSEGQIASAQTRLLSYVGIVGENFPRAMQAVIDQSARLGISVEQSAEVIGKALERPSKAAEALSRQGFGASFTDEVKRTIKALEEQGKAAEAQNLILDILEESYKGAAEAARNTLGGALTALSNNFNDLLTGGASFGVVTDAVNTLADNLEGVGKVANGLAVVFGAQLVGSLYAYVSAQVAAAAATARAATNMFTMQRASAAATLGMTALTGATNLFSRALALVGGPIGVAVIGTMVAMQATFTSTAEAQSILNDEMSGFTNAASEYRKASDETRKQIEQDVQARINAYKTELEAVNTIISSLEGENSLFKASRTIGSWFGVDNSVKDVQGLKKEIEGAINQLGVLQGQFADIRAGKKTGDNGVTDEQLKAQQDAVKKLDEMYSRQRDNIQGVNAATVKYHDDLKELDTLYAAGRLTVEGYNEAVANVTKTFQESQTKNEKWFDSMNAFGEQAARNLQDTFADYLFNPFEEGLGGMVRGFAQVMQRMIAEAASARLLEGIFGGSSGGGAGGLFGSLLGGLGGLFGGSQGGAARLLQTGSSNFIGPLPAFAEGGFLGAGQWGIAGENEAELIYGGRTGVSVIPPDKMGDGGNNYTFNVGTEVNQNDILRLQNLILELAGPGKIEMRVKNASNRRAL